MMLAFHDGGSARNFARNGKRSVFGRRSRICPALAGTVNWITPPAAIGGNASLVMAARRPACQSEGMAAGGAAKDRTVNSSTIEPSVRHKMNLDFMCLLLP